jgi:hypothetical protein
LANILYPSIETFSRYWFFPRTIFAVFAGKITGMRGDRWIIDRIRGRSGRAIEPASGGKTQILQGFIEKTIDFLQKAIAL